MTIEQISAELRRLHGNYDFAPEVEEGLPRLADALDQLAKEQKAKKCKVCGKESDQPFHTCLDNRAEKCAEEIWNAIQSAIMAQRDLLTKEDFAAIIRSHFPAQSEDTKRLDWLEKNAIIRWPYGNQTIINADIVADKSFAVCPTVRQAIDAEIEK